MRQRVAFFPFFGVSLLNRYLFFYTLAALTVASANVVAQEEHFDVFVGVSGGQTAYGGIDVDDGDVTLNERIFESEMGENPLDDIFFSDEPGFNHPEDDAVLPAGVSSLAFGDELFVNKLPLTVTGAPSDLFFWDGVGSPSFAPAAGVAFDIATPGAGGSIGTAGAGGGFDDHPLFELSAGGSLPTPGIYLGSFEVQVNALEPSDPLFLVMGTEGLITADFLGISQTDFDMLTDDDLDEELEAVIEVAVGFVETNVVPEPASATLIGIAVAALAGRRRR